MAADFVFNVQAAMGVVKNGIRGPGCDNGWDPSYYGVLPLWIGIHLGTEG